MITCPECGTAANDDAKFCDRCGQGLGQALAAPAALPTLKPGTVLKGEFEIVELLSSTSLENRYRATHRVNHSGASVQLRERVGPSVETAHAAEEAAVETPPAVPSAPADDPNGPRAKTRELPKLSAAAGSESAIETVASEPSAPQSSAATEPLVLTEALAESAANGLETQSAPAEQPASESAEPAPVAQEDLGEVFGRVLALSQTLNHPAFHRALSGFASDGMVYLVYPDEALTPLARRTAGIRMREPEALAAAIQLSQAVSFVHRRGLRVNDICPDSVVYAADGRIKLTGLDWVSNDTELQSEPIFNDGYTAPEIYKGKKVDKRADVFSIGALLYTCLTGERIAAESWREEAGTVAFYPPHVITPALEKVLRQALAFNPEERWPTVDAFKAELIKLGSLIRIRAAALTDVGMVREHNEDSVMAIEYSRQSLVEPAQHSLYLVADGMGGAEAGEVASAIAVEAVRDYVEGRLSSEEARDPGRLLIDALEEANRRILEHQAANPEQRGMGSTAVSALIIPPDAAVAWVGDSRAYMVDAQGIRQLTKDHSLVQRLIEIGQLTPEQARHHEHKNVITRSLGARQSGPAGAEALAVRLKRGDRLVLCSDGLTTHVEDAQIGEIVRRHADPDEAARELVVAANAGGGTDNVSVVVVFAE